MISFAWAPPKTTTLLSSLGPAFLVLRQEDITGGVLLMDSLFCWELQFDWWQI